MDTQDFNDFIDDEIESVRSKVESGCMVEYVCTSGLYISVYKSASDGREGYWSKVSGNTLPCVVQFDSAYDAAKSFVETITEIELSLNDEKEGSTSSVDRGDS